MANMNFGVNILPKTNNTYSLGNSDYKWNIYANTINGTEVDELTLPSVTSEDDDKILKVSEGEWTVGTAPSSLNLGETSTTAYRGDRGAAAYAAAITNVDSTPTSGSTHLLTSGGAYTALDDKAPKANPVFTGSISMGRLSNTTIGSESVAEGASTTASGAHSHAEGLSTTASGTNSHAEGGGTTASGSQSHAEGGGTTASGVNSHAEGSNTTAYIANSHAEGYGTVASGANSHAEGNTTTTSGNHSHAEGSGNQSSTKIVNRTTYTGTGAHGESSHSEGDITWAIGANSHAEGGGTTASGAQSHAEGSGTVASNSNSHSEGAQTTASGTCSHAEGYGTVASGGNSHAEGASTIASGYQSHAEGAQSTASGSQSHAEGTSTLAEGASSHVSGTYNIADSYANWPEWVSGTSYEVGDKVKITTTNNGTTTIVGYICTTANTDTTFTSSKWENQFGKMNYAEIVGNGTGTSARSNARALDWSGNEYLNGDLYINCNDNSTGGNKVISSADIMTGATSSSAGSAGLVPAPEAGDDGKFLKGDGTWSEASVPEMTGASENDDGISGAVPTPYIGDETKFLMGDGTWSDLPELIGADSVNNGVSGAVPAPLAGEEEYFLKGDGSWSSPYMIGSDGPSDGSAGFVPAPLAADVNKFLCGAGTWEDPFVMTGATPDSDGESGAVPAPLAGEEDMFLKGDGTWSEPSIAEMTGADSSSDGAGGAVPAPMAGEEDYFLKGDGTWSAVDVSPMVGATDSTDGEGGTVPAPLTGEEDAFLRGDGTWAYPDSGLPFPSDTSPLANDGTYLYLVTADNGDISSEFIDSEMTGATSSTAGTGGLVPAPSAGDEDKFLAGDGTYKSGGLPMVILSYGSSTWAEFEAAYNNNVIVYCRASSNSNPASGSQTRMAFMAYVNNATTPTEVEFQYYRSMSAHSATAMGDQVFVYKLTKTGGWSVTTRDASIKQIKADTGTALGVSWSSNVVTLTNTMTAANMPMSSSDATTVSSAINDNSQAIATLNSNFVNLYGNLATGISYQKYGKIVIIYFNGNTVAGSSGWTDLLTLPGNLGQSRYTVHVKAMSGQDVRIGSGNVISYRGSAGDIFGTIVYIQS